MNITGYGQYSKGSAVARDPRKLKDSQLKLIFIYPILMSDKIKVQSTPPFEQLIRDFLSITFLSDLFIENAFSVIGTANQVRPLWDDRDQVVDPTSGLLRFQAAERGISPAGYGTTPPSYNVDAAYAGVLQQKINQKTAVIQQLLKTNPKFAKFRPYIETITMGNMIEVPVIIGTSLFQVDTLSLMWVLIAAIGLNRSLDSEANIDFIFDKLKNMSKEDYWKLLNNLIENPVELEYLGSWFQRGVIGLSRGIAAASRRFNVLPTVRRAAVNKIIKTRAKIREEEAAEFRTQQQFAPLYLNQTNLDNIKVYFKFVLNRQAAESRFGINATDEQTGRTAVYTTSLSTISTHHSKLLIDSFIDTISTTGTVLLVSIGNLIKITQSSLDIVEIKKKVIDSQLNNKIENIVKELFVNINESFQEADPVERISLLKDLCSINTMEAFNNIEHGIGKAAISAGSFTVDQYLFFADVFEKASSISSSLALKIQRQILELISDDRKPNFNANLVKLKSNFYFIVDKFMKEFIDEEKQTIDSQFILEALNIADRSKILNQIVPIFSKGMVNIFYFLFLSKLQSVLCRFIAIADVEIEKSKNEVTAWPNYTLVLPVEIVMALHAAIIGKSWQHILAGGHLGSPLNTSSKSLTTGSTSTFTVNFNYIKGIVKYIAQRLNVPNLIVVDSRKGEIYYQLMNQTDVNKTKIQTLATFVQSKVDRPLTTTQSQGYY